MVYSALHGWFQNDYLVFILTHIWAIVAHHASLHCVLHACVLFVLVFSLQASWRHITCLSRIVKAYRQCLIETAMPMCSDPIPGVWNPSTYFVIIIIEMWQSFFLFLYWTNFVVFLLLCNWGWTYGFLRLIQICLDCSSLIKWINSISK